MRREENTYWREAGTTGGTGYETNNLLEEMLSRPAGQSGGFNLEREVAARPLLAFGAALVAGFALGSMGDNVGGPYNRNHGWLAPLDRELDLLKSAALAALTTTATENLREIVPGETGAALTSMINRKLQDMGLPASQQAFSAQSSPHSASAGHSQASYGGQHFTSQPEQMRSQADWGDTSRSQRAGTGIGRDTGGDFGGTQTSSAPNASFGTGAGTGAVGYDSPPEQGGSVSIENTRVEGTAHLDPYYPPGGADKPIAGSRTPGQNRALDTHEAAERKPDADQENKDLNWR
jgi:hypothetical protein